MKEIIDITLPLRPGIVAWPGSIGLELHRSMKMEEGDVANNTNIRTDVHIGTHIDAPWHSIPDGATIDQLSLGDLIGKAYVVFLPDAAEITADVLTSASIPENVERLLFRTRNSELWQMNVNEFKRDYVALTNDAAEWVVKRGIRLVGIDYLSIQKFSTSMETHNILFRKNIIIAEGLNLLGVQQGWYELICLPLRLVGCEGSPVRAVLRSLDDELGEHA